MPKQKFKEITKGIKNFFSKKKHVQLPVSNSTPNLTQEENTSTKNLLEVAATNKSTSASHLEKLSTEEITEERNNQEQVNDIKLINFSEALTTNNNGKNSTSKNSLSATEREKNQPQNAQEWLDKNYPKEQRKKNMSLTISGYDIESLEENHHWNKLTGHLDLTDFVNLQILDCRDNQIVSLNLIGLNKLSILACNTNLLNSLDFLSTLNPKSLTNLSITNNNISDTDIAIFSNFVNLQILAIGNNDEERIKQGIYNRFYGSLNCLSNLQNLEGLDIRNTDISSGLEYLPTEKLEVFYYSFSSRPESKVQNLEVDKEKMNILLRDNLVKKKVEEITLFPYKEFSELKKIGEGGFGTVYKAKWEIPMMEYAIAVALKELNKKDINIEDLTKEYANHVMIHSETVSICHGIIQISEDNYALFSPYCKHGTLRNYLSNNKDMTMINKYIFLRLIVEGLQDIHDQGIIHKDFHTNNILISESKSSETKPWISDLGLSSLINDVEKNNNVMGVIPFISPELLQKKLYTSAVDIYAFSMVMYEVLTGYLPFYNKDWNDLSFQQAVVFKGLRPEITVKMIPQLEEIMKECWQVNPKQRPTAQELNERFFEKLIRDKNFEELLFSPEYNHPYQSNLQCHPSVCWTSKWWKIVGKIQDISISNKKTTNNKNQQEISLLESQLNSLKTTLNEQQQILFKQFIILRKNYTRNNNEKLEEELINLEESLEETGFSEKIMDEMKKLCDQIAKLEDEIVNETYQATIEQTT